MKKAVSLLLASAMVVCLCSCSLMVQNTARTITAMNTVMQITVFNNSQSEAERIAGRMVDSIVRIDALMDANSFESDVYKVNNASIGTSVEIASETADVLNISLQANALTKGCFDVTLMPVIEEWGFHDGTYGVPSAESLKNAMGYVDAHGFSVQGDKLTKSTDVRITLGGIAKGYLGDELLKIAAEENASALLSLGGNIVLCGDKADGSLWSVGVKNPHNTESLACSFESEGNRSVVTSGGYERFFEYGGKSYHHIIDPATGYPAESDLYSVTVIGENGALCDAFSTGLFVMGKEKAVAFAKENNDFQFIFITTDNEILYTSGIVGMECEDKAFTLQAIQ